MVTELKRKEICTVKEMLDIFNSKINSFKSDMEAIDAKYRKLADEEKKELKANLADIKAQQKVWQKMFNSFETTVVSEVLGSSFESTSTIDTEVTVTPETVEPAEEMVVDTIYEDNNIQEPFADDIPEDAAPEQTEEVPVSEEQPEEVVVDEPGEESAANDVFDPNEVQDIIDETWPEYPEEWK